MALRSIGNIIGTRRAAAKSTSSKTSAETSPETKPIKSRVLTLNLHGSTDSSDSEEIDEISRLFEKAPESSKKALKGQPIASSSSSSTSANSSQITRRKPPVKRLIDEDDDNDDDKENRKPQIPAQTQLDQTSLHDDTISIVSSARAPSGSSITITKRVKLAQATLKSDAIFIESKREEKAKKSPAKPRVRTPVKKLTIETPKKEEKDFDYFLSHSVNESMSRKEEKPESESIESSNSRPKRRSAQKAMSKVLLIKANDDLDLQDVDSDDEDKSIKKKYKSRTSKEDEEMKLFESEEQDDEMEYKPKRKSKSSKAKKPLKTSVVKSPQIKRASNRSRTKSKHHYDALNDDEATEKQLQEAAKEYNEIKNYKLIVE